MSDVKKIYIVCAANKWPDGLIIPSARHWDKNMHEVADRIFKGDKKEKLNCEQGFIDQHGKFWGRGQAMQIVKDFKQKFDADRNGGNHAILFSEGLY